MWQLQQQLRTTVTCYEELAEKTRAFPQRARGCSPKKKSNQNQADDMNSSETFQPNHNTTALYANQPSTAPKKSRVAPRRDCFTEDGNSATKAHAHTHTHNTQNTQNTKACGIIYHAMQYTSTAFAGNTPAQPSRRPNDKTRHSTT